MLFVDLLLLFYLKRREVVKEGERVAYYSKTVLIRKFLFSFYYCFEEEGRGLFKGGSKKRRGRVEILVRLLIESKRVKVIN